ncbi:hypothetical protein M427DRAFT_286160 [Gonapodya prolifera JEL478]|uniref:Uncharacterized protein n=1 Tax=Gonapodya prolifera (strain JEL478) TaxID=1344416 RepID=A0A139AK95_GONPJ|nr:hypothetical protein M427DRAFT_286160 [Gonapodya prolifera JEL478]|eukprot:KXS16845.1 hypothetical protein M427DRAFT_286160 [Gonapodya prolifera JEL478]
MSKQPQSHLSSFVRGSVAILAGLAVLALANVALMPSHKNPHPRLQERSVGPWEPSAHHYLHKRADPTTGSFTAAERNARITAEGYIAATFSGGIQVWSGLAKSIRTIARGSGAIGSIYNTGSLDFTAAIMSYLGPAIILGICFAVGIVVLILSPYFCCCICKSRKGQFRRYTTNQKVVAWVLLSINLFCLTVAIICGFSGTALLSAQIQQNIVGFNNTITDTSIQLNGLTPAFDGIVTDIYATIDTSINSVLTAIDVNGFIVTMGTAISEMVTVLTTTSTDLNDFKAAGNGLVSNIYNIVGNLSVTGFAPRITTSYTAIQNSITGLDNPNTFTNNGQTYGLTNSMGISPPAISAAPAGLSAAATTLQSSLLTPVSNFPDLGALATNLNANFGTSQLQAQFQALATSGTTSFKTSSRAQLNGITSMASGLLGNLSTTVTTLLGGYQTQMQTLDDTYIKNYDTYRNYGYMGLHGLVALFYLVIILGLALRKPGMIRW